MENQEQNDKPPEGYKIGAVQYFTGNAYVKMYVVPEEITNCSVADVYFEPEVINNWHTHPRN